MNDYLRFLAEVDLAGFFITLTAIMGVVIVGKDLFVKFFDTVGFEFSWVRKAKERKELQEKVIATLENISARQDGLKNHHEQDIEELQSFNKNILEMVESIKNDVDALTQSIERREATKRFNVLKSNILNSADKITRFTTISSELVDQVYDEIAEYEALSEKWGFENNKINASIKIINQKYEQLMLERKVFSANE